MNKQKLRNSGVLVGCVTLGLWLGGCSSSEDEPNTGGTISRDDTSSEGRSSSNAHPGGTSEEEPSDPTSGDDDIIVPMPGNPRGDAGGNEEACASSNSSAELQELALAFAFDVSGSMGEGDKPFHDKELKWDPVVAASKAFFEAKDTVRVSASMTFFPTKDANRCDAEEYATPDVPLQSLPSTAFSEAIDAIFPDRGGTPTHAVLQATIGYVRGLIEAGSTAKHAIVLVTDGMPQGCTRDTDTVDAVAELVREISDEVPVYVIGIENPVTEAEPNPPDNVTGLHTIALAGGTGDAFIIDTGNPTQTIADFDEVIQSIRSSGLSCELEIPPAPSGQTFDKDRVNVSLQSGEGVEKLVYSPNCEEEDAWHYDDEGKPTRIVLCERTCEVTKKLADVDLQVEFGCERRVRDVQ
jgi:hypothetical protein